MDSFRLSDTEMLPELKTEGLQGLIPSLKHMHTLKLTSISFFPSSFVTHTQTLSHTHTHSVAAVVGCISEGSE